MTAAKKPLRRRTAAAKPALTPRSKAAAPRAVAAAPAKPKPTTLRLRPSLQEGLTVLQEAVKRPLNKLVNEAVEEFLARQAAMVERDLEGLLTRIKAVRRADPKFKAAVQAFADAEGQHAADDPAEGEVVVDAQGPSQRAVRSLLARK